MVEQNGQGGTEGGQSHGEDRGGEQVEQETKKDVQDKGDTEHEHVQQRSFPVCQIVSCINEINLLVGGTELSNHGNNELGK